MSSWAGCVSGRAIVIISCWRNNYNNFKQYLQFIFPGDTYLRWGEAYRPDVNNEGCNIVTIQSIPEKLSQKECHEQKKLFY